MAFFDINIEKISPKTLVIICAIAFILSIGLNVLGGIGLINPIAGHTIDQKEFVKRAELELLLKAQMQDTIDAIRGEFATKEVMELKFQNVNEKLDTIIERLP